MFQVHRSTFRYGSFLNALLSFLIVATIVFFAVVVPLTALDAPAQPAAHRRTQALKRGTAPNA